MEEKSLKKMQNWVWILIYGGLIVVSIGIFVLRGGSDDFLGWLMVFIGGLIAAGGTVLIGVRARWP